MRRAVPMARWGMSPSPAISLDVSMTITRLLNSSAKTRAISRNLVVLPTPGRPNSKTLRPASIRSRIWSMVPNMARPTRKVKPIIVPWRLRMAEILCKVPSIPARLSAPNSPTVEITWSKSALATGVADRVTELPGRRASGARPKSMITSSKSSLGSLSSAF